MIYLLFMTFLLQQTSAECPETKTVGDTCYTRVEYTETSDYGCFEGCAYKKTLAEEDGQLYCFKRGSLPVSESECAPGDGYFDYTAIASIEEPVVIENNFEPSSVTVSSYCYSGRKTIQPGGEWTSPCNVGHITGYYDSTKGIVTCQSYHGPNTYHSNFVISRDISKPGGCKITLPRNALFNTNVTMDIASQTATDHGMVTIKNSFSNSLKVTVYYHPDYNVPIQVGQSEVREVLVSSIHAHYTISGNPTIYCLSYINLNNPPQYYPEFVITQQNGNPAGCEIGLPTSTPTTTDGK